jgi:hypothetical protein
MANVGKMEVLESFRQRFGDVRAIKGSRSLFSIANDGARVYFRYSKVHPRGRAFFGLRDVDLRELEGRNAYLIFMLDDGTPPLFIPYADFEEVFRLAECASDGQYKAQLLTQRDARQLYIARQGRFNVEGYVGAEILERSLEARRLRPDLNLTHAQVQTLLAGLGNLKGYDVFVPANNVNSLDWSLTRSFPLLDTVPPGFGQASCLSEVDVVWVTAGRNSVEALFEVEHSTSVYSGLLRFNDILLTCPKLKRFSIVSDDLRRSLFSRQLLRPTFRKSGLAELCSFLEYGNVLDWHSRLYKEGAHDQAG